MEKIHLGRFQRFWSHYRRKANGVFVEVAIVFSCAKVLLVDYS